jgi:hypothetical protein
LPAINRRGFSAMMLATTLRARYAGDIALACQGGLPTVLAALAGQRMLGDLGVDEPCEHQGHAQALPRCLRAERLEAAVTYPRAYSGFGSLFCPRSCR